MSDKPKFLVSEVFLYVSEDEEGEGMAAARMGEWLTPLIGADKARTDSLRPFAEEVCAKTGKKVSLIRFSNRETLEEIMPKSHGLPEITMDEIMAKREQDQEALAYMAEQQAKIDGPHGVWIAERQHWYLVAKDCTIYLQERPAHCDRGNWLAQIDAWGELGRSLDHADLWPRFYMDRTRAEQEIRDWLIKRGQWDPAWDKVEEPSL